MYVTLLTFWDILPYMPSSCGKG